MCDDKNRQAVMYARNRDVGHFYGTLAAVAVMDEKAVAELLDEFGRQSWNLIVKLWFFFCFSGGVDLCSVVTPNKLVDLLLESLCLWPARAEEHQSATCCSFWPLSCDLLPRRDSRRGHDGIGGL